MRTTIDPAGSTYLEAGESRLGRTKILGMLCGRFFLCFRATGIVGRCDGLGLPYAAVRSVRLIEAAIVNESTSAMAVQVERYLSGRNLVALNFPLPKRNH